jgi:hypothetical protein
VIPKAKIASPEDTVKAMAELKNKFENSQDCVDQKEFHNLKDGNICSEPLLLETTLALGVVFM